MNGVPGAVGLPALARLPLSRDSASATSHLLLGSTLVLGEAAPSQGVVHAQQVDKLKRTKKMSSQQICSMHPIAIGHLTLRFYYYNSKPRLDFKKSNFAHKAMRRKSDNVFKFLQVLYNVKLKREITDKGMPSYIVSEITLNSQYRGSQTTPWGTKMYVACNSSEPKSTYSKLIQANLS